MEIAKLELAAVESAAAESIQIELKELNELQLALVGGGCGEVLLG